MKRFLLIMLIALGSGMSFSSHAQSGLLVTNNTLCAMHIGVRMDTNCNLNIANCFLGTVGPMSTTVFTTGCGIVPGSWAGLPNQVAARSAGGPCTNPPAGCAFSCQTVGAINPMGVCTGPATVPFPNGCCANTLALTTAPGFVLIATIN